VIRTVFSGFDFYGSKKIILSKVKDLPFSLVKIFLEYLPRTWSKAYSPGTKLLNSFAPVRHHAFASSLIHAITMVAGEAMCKKTLNIVLFSNFPRYKHEH
jgi:hypothetical protein